MKRKVPAPACAPLSSASTATPGARSCKTRSTVSSEALSASVTRSMRPLKWMSRGRWYKSRSTCAPACAALSQISDSSLKPAP